MEPVVSKNIYDKVFKSKEKQAKQYNQRAKDLGKLSTGDTVRLVPPGNRRGEAVKARVNGQVGPRSFEVETENGSIYRRNRRHLRRTKEEFSKTEVAVKLHSGASTPVDTPIDPTPEVSRETEEASPSRQSSVPELSASPSRQSSVPEMSESNLRPPPTKNVTTTQTPIVTRSGRTVRKPKYLGD